MKFKAGDFVASNNTQFIGIIVKEEFEDGENYRNVGEYYTVFWNDGDTTAPEDHNSMSKIEMKPEYWTMELIRFYLDNLSPQPEIEEECK